MMMILGISTLLLPVLELPGTLLLAGDRGQSVLHSAGEMKGSSLAEDQLSPSLHNEAPVNQQDGEGTTGAHVQTVEAQTSSEWTVHPRNP